MRRTTSALTTTILGAVLSASTVSAQQSLPSASARRAGKPATPPAKAGADAELDPGFGMAAARGPRYLLRNGLDYIDYQEYERALKYLREAEKRQAELGASEKLKLKQGIERAQRGLREAIGSEKPYALSSRSRRPGGVVVASSEPKGAPASSAKSSKPAPSRREGDDRGEPIRLTAVDVPAEGAADSVLPTAPAPREVAPPPAETSPLAELPPVPDAAAGAREAVAAAPSDEAPVAMEAPALTPIDAQAPAVFGIRSASAAAAPQPQPQPQPAAAPALGSADASAPAVFGMQSALAATQPQPQPAAAPGGATPEPLSAAAAAQADLTTPFPELSAAGPAAPKADAPAPADAGLTLSAASPEPAAAPASPAAAPAPAPITLETPAEAAPKADGPAPAPVQEAPVAVPTPAADPAPSPPDAGTPALPPLGSADVPEPDGPAAEPEAPRVAAAPADAPATAPDADLDLPALPSDLRDRADAASQPLPDAADELPPLPGGPSGAPADQAPPVAPPSGAPARSPEAAPAEETPVAVPAEASGPIDRVQLPGEAPAPAAEPVPLTGDAPAPIQETPAPAPEPEAPAAEETPAPAATPAPAEESPAPAAEAVPPAAPVVEAPTPREPAGLTRNRGAVDRSESLLPERPAPISTLSPELRDRVDEVARRQEEEYRVSQAQPRPAAPAPRSDVSSSDLRTQTQIDISRAPSPAEARPIRAIPVPEDWVPLGARQWTAQRKYWAAAATCHLPLYFQDPMLERYGHSVENFIGPKGRFFAYPVDKHTETTQRNQMVQPWFSAGLFAGQILALPYNLIMDPPWEAQYDLGYWRPGDRIPTDMYYLPLHGTGPPLRGRQY